MRVEAFVETELGLEGDSSFGRLARPRPVVDRGRQTSLGVEHDAHQLCVIELSRDLHRSSDAFFRLRSFGGGRLTNALGPEREERVGGEKTCDRVPVVRLLQEASAAGPQVLHPLLGRPVPDRSRPARRHHEHAGQRAELVVDRRAAFLVLLQRQAVLLESAVARGHVADPLVQSRQQVRLDEVE